ncbi:hypothetical protein D3C72_2409460 [compost metagenome]
MIDAARPEKVAGGDRVNGGEAARMAFAVKALAERFQHRIGAAKAGRRVHGDDRAILDEPHRLLRALHLLHRLILRFSLPEVTN